MAVDTADTLLLGTGVDLAGLQAGLAGATRLIDSFGDDLSLDQTGSAIAEGLIDNLRATFAQRSTDLKHELADGIIDPAQFNTLAQESANEFAVGLARGLSTLGAAGLDTADVERQFAAAFSGIGANAGAALAAAVENSTAQGLRSQAAGAVEVANANVGAASSTDVLREAIQNLSVAAEHLNDALDHNGKALGIVAAGARNADVALSSMQVNARNISAALTDTNVKTRTLGSEFENAGEHFTHAGRRGIEALFGVSLAVTALASNASNVTQRIEQTLQTISGFGLLLGPEGLIVSAAATAIEAVIEVVTRGNEELKKAAEDFKQQVQQMILNADQAGLQKKIFDIQTIDPRAEKALGEENVGLTAMQDHVAKLKARIDSLNQSPNFEDQLKIGPAVRDLQAFQEKMQPLLDDIKKLQDALAITPDKLKELTVVGFDPTVVSEGIAKLTNSMQALGAIAPEVNNRLKELGTPGFLPLTKQGQQLADTINQQALAAVDRLTTRLAAQHGVVDADTIALLEMLKQFQQFDAVKVLRFKVPSLSQEKLEVTIADLELLVPKPPTIPVHIEPDIKAFDPQQFQAIAQQLVDLQSRAAALATAGDTAASQQARVAAVQQTQLLADSEKAVLDHLVAMHAPAEVVQQVFQQMQQIMKDLGIDTSKVDEKLHGLGAAAKFAIIGQDLSSLNNVLGDTATKAGAAFTAIGQLITAVQALQTESKAGVGFDFSSLASGVTSVIGVVGALGSLLGGVFGESPTQKEHDAILQQNNEALEQLRVSLNKFGQTGDTLQQVVQAVAHLNLGELDKLAKQTFRNPSDALDELRHELKDTGVSLAELQAIAKENGITLLDSKGRLVAGALDQLQQVLDATSDKVLKFGNDFQSQVDLQQLIDKALGKSSPALDFSDLTSEFQKQAPAAFQQFFGNLAGADFQHLTTDQIALFRQDLANLLKAIQAGTITLAQLGNFSDVTQLEQAASTWLDSISAMSDAADAATQSLLNVPTGFKLALAEFNATTPADLIPHPATPSTPVLPPPIQGTPTHVGIDDPAVGKFFLTVADTGMPISDRSIAAMADKLADAIRARSGGGGTIRVDSINIDAGEQDPVELTNKIVTQLRVLARTGLNPLAGVLN